MIGIIAFLLPRPPQTIRQQNIIFQAIVEGTGFAGRSHPLLAADLDPVLEIGKADCKVLPTDSSWFGVTYREDKPHVVAAIAKLVADGEYPERLFTHI